jgi:hypothetical protein
MTFFVALERSSRFNSSNSMRNSKSFREKHQRPMKRQANRSEDHGGKMGFRV